MDTKNKKKSKHGKSSCALASYEIYVEAEEMGVGNTLSEKKFEECGEREGPI